MLFNFEGSNRYEYTESRSCFKSFPGTLALDDVSVEFQSGKVNALIGKNGSGKSTLVKIINGVQPPTKGEIYLDDQKLGLQIQRMLLIRGISTVYPRT